MTLVIEMITFARTSNITWFSLAPQFCASKIFGKVFLEQNKLDISLHVHFLKKMCVVA